MIAQSRLQSPVKTGFVASALVTLLCGLALPLIFAFPMFELTIGIKGLETVTFDISSWDTSFKNCKGSTTVCEAFNLLKSTDGGSFTLASIGSDINKLGDVLGTTSTPTPPTCTYNQGSSFCTSTTNNDIDTDDDCPWADAPRNLKVCIFGGLSVSLMLTVFIGVTGSGSCSHNVGCLKLSFVFPLGAAAGALGVMLLTYYGDCSVYGSLSSLGSKSEGLMSVNLSVAVMVSGTICALSLFNLVGSCICLRRDAPAETTTVYMNPGQTVAINGDGGYDPTVYTAYSDAKPQQGTSDQNMQQMAQPLVVNNTV